MSDNKQVVLQQDETAQSRAVSTSVTPGQMLMAALEQGVEIEKLEKLMELQERWEAKESRKAFDSAIAMARSEIKPIVKSAEVDFTSQKGRTHYKHETLDGIASQIDPILSRYGLSYRFRSRQEGQVLHVTCVIAHKDGHSEETTLYGPPDQSGNKNSYQAVGSAATYLQRYTLKLALGLSAAKDDDSNANNDSEAQQTLTNQQIDNLRKAMAVAGVSDQEFCNHKSIKINRVEELPQARLAGAIAMLQKYAGAAQ
jgi:hypothetical protein